AEDGIRDFHVTGVQSVLFRSSTQFPLTTLNGNTMEAPITLDVGSIVPHIATLDELITGEVGEVYGRVDGTVSGTSQTLRLNMVRSEERRVGKARKPRPSRQPQ